jgi:hypothetical protein
LGWKVELGRLPKVTELRLEGWISFKDPVSFGAVPSLEAVSLSNTCPSWHKTVKMSELLRNTSGHELALEFNSEKIWVQPEAPSRLERLCSTDYGSCSCSNSPKGSDLTWTMFI